MAHLQIARNCNLQQAFRKACMKVNNAIRYTDEEVEGMPTFVKIDYLKAKGYLV